MSFSRIRKLVLKMGKILSRSKIDQINWEELETRTPEEQKDFLSKWEEKFKVEPVSAKDRNVREGDHLMVDRYGTYTHHFICTKVQGDGITVMEYSGRFELSAVGLVNPEKQLGKVQEKSLTFEELENMKVQKRVWPKKLRRFNAKDSVKRAKSREGEQKYNCLTNNCEHFVVWCICGLSVSLQVKSWYTWAKELVCVTTRECFIQGASHLLGLLFVFLLAYVSDHFFVKILSQHENAAFVGFFIALVFKLRLCYHEVREALDDRKSEDIETDHDLDATLTEIIAKAWFHLTLGAAGLYFALPYGTIGSSIGTFIGIVVGNRLGAIAKWYVCLAEPFKFVGLYPHLANYSCIIFVSGLIGLIRVFRFSAFFVILAIPLPARA